MTIDNLDDLKWITGILGLVAALVTGIGKYMMPIALNNAFSIFFLMSLYFVRQAQLNNLSTQAIQYG